jgi:hypothetical protein
MHPVAYSAVYQGEGRNRLTVFFRLLVAIPWLIVAMFWGLAAYFAVIIAWFALLFTGRYPEGIYNFNAGFIRFINRVNGFAWLLTDEWPPFDGDDDYDYPVRMLIPKPQAEYSRAKVFFRIILAIPVAILAYIMNIILQLVGIVAWFVMIFTAKLPEGLYKPLRAASAYTAKASAYYFLITEDWPPFWTEESEELPRIEGGTPSTEVVTPPPPPAPPRKRSNGSRKPGAWATKFLAPGACIRSARNAAAKSSQMRSIPG